MFIPAEGIYYDLMINEIGAIKVNTRDLVEYAAEKKVSIVSPNSFYAMLQTILEGLKAFQIEKSWVEVRKNVERLGLHLVKFDEHMKRLGNHLTTVCNFYNTAYKELSLIDKDVVKITEGERQIEPLQIDKPSVD
jgi:DNA recombination protein RmuC